MKKILISSVFVLVLIGLLLISALTQTGGGAPPEAGQGGTDRIVVIQKGFSAEKAAILLKDSGIIKDTRLFVLGSVILGRQNQLKAGTYKLSSSMTNFEIIFKLVKGEVIAPDQLKVTFPEGSSIYKMGIILERNGYGQAKEFRGLTEAEISSSLKEEFPFLREIPTRSLEGFLFPDTYIFEKSVDEKALAKLMLKRFNQVVAPYWRENASAVKFNLFEIITLASIIEKEAQKPEEREIISSVFHNRLKIKMALESCPTIKYALNDPTPVVYLWQLKVKSPYNTYLNRGLPPGPICNPGLETIKAAVYPAKTDYLFFVAKKDGEHVFSRTLEEHNRAKSRNTI